MNAFQNFLDRRADDIGAAVAALALAGVIISPITIITILLLCVGGVAAGNAPPPYAECAAGIGICVLAFYISRRGLVLGATHVTALFIGANVEAATNEIDAIDAFEEGES